VSWCNVKPAGSVVPLANFHSHPPYKRRHAAFRQERNTLPIRLHHQISILLPIDIYVFWPDMIPTWRGRITQAV